MTERSLAARGIRSWWFCAKGCGVEWNRNALVAKFLAGEGTHLLFVDADMTWSPKDIARWLEADRDVIVGAALARRVDRVQWNVVPFETPVEPDADGYAEILKGGTGLMLVRRNVIEALWEGPKSVPYFATHGHEEEYRTVFRFDICPDTHELRGEDFNFCDDARAAGFKIWCDSTARVGHMASVPISAGQEDLVRWLKTGPDRG